MKNLINVEYVGAADPALAMHLADAPSGAEFGGYAERSRLAWGLTPAESMVATDIARGRTPQLIAHERRVSVHTVRTQLKRVLRKSGCHRQVELAIRIRSL